MDERLLAPLDPASRTVATALALGYLDASVKWPSTVEFETLLDAPDPVGLTVRLACRVLHVGCVDGLALDESRLLAAELVRYAAVAPLTRRSALEALLVATSQAPEMLRDDWLSPVDVEMSRWMTMVDASCTALRASIVTISQEPLGSLATTKLLARATSLSFLS